MEVNNDDAWTAGIPACPRRKQPIELERCPERQLFAISAALDGGRRGRLRSQHDRVLLIGQNGALIGWPGVTPSCNSPAFTITTPFTRTYRIPSEYLAGT